MKLINFQGLNCYHNCIVSIAASRKPDYTAVFAGLWSETDFRYDSHRKVYLTRRLITSLKKLGFTFAMLDSSTPDAVGQSLAQPAPGEPFLVGMDAFYVPWCQLYGIHHGPHYFIASRREDDNVLTCWDPTYRMEEQKIGFGQIPPHAFDISRMAPISEPEMQQNQETYSSAVETSPVQEIRAQAKEILRCHPQLETRLSSWIETCSYSPGDLGQRPAKYVDALTDNRYLYRHYLARQQLPYSAGQFLFTKEHFSRWTAIKNGLYKAALVPNPKAVTAEILPLLKDILTVEMNLARCILELPDITPQSHIPVIQKES